MTAVNQAPASALTAQAIPFNAAPPAKISPWFLSRWVDLAMVGGLSLIVFVLVTTFFERNTKNDMVATVAAQLAFIVNNPHFMSSYAFLYWDQRHRLFANWRMILAAFIAPAILIAYYAYAFAQADSKLFGYAVNAMYFFVGWHYVKQIYGVMMVASARRAYFYSEKEKLLLRWLLFPLWMVSYLNGNQSSYTYDFYGVKYSTLALPSWGLTVCQFSVIIASLAFAAIFIHKWIKTGKCIDLVSICALLSIYIWHLPQAYHNLMWYLIPLFHSLQYMLYVLTYKHNQLRDEAQRYSEGGERQRHYYATRFLLYISIMGITAYLTFTGIPETLDRLVPYDHGLLGSSLFLFMFTNFINIHHYFIDSAIWRRDNEKMGQYVVKPKPRQWAT